MGIWIILQTARGRRPLARVCTMTTVIVKLAGRVRWDAVASADRASVVEHGRLVAVPTLLARRTAGGVMAGGVRDRMVESAIVLLATRGFHATSFSSVLARSAAPRGSIYHHFPEGKEQLIAAAIDLAGSRAI